MKKVHDQKGIQEKKIEELESEVSKWKEKYLRALADYQNLEKRVVETRSEDVKYAAKNIVVKFLPVLDTFAKVQQHLKDQGLDLALKQLGDFLADEKIEKIEVIGKKFDPHTMECIEVIGDGDEVIEELRPGYTMHDQVIRVAQVKVGKRT